MLIPPIIGYGSFNNEGREIKQGHRGEVRVGWGILNQPDGFYGMVTDDREDEALNEYLGLATDRYELAHRAYLVRTDPFPFRYLVGISISNSEISGDQFQIRSQFGWFGIYYEHTGLLIGITPADTLRQHFNGDTRTVTAVEFDDATNTATITLDSGLIFALHPRWLHLTDHKPTLSQNSDSLLRSLYDYHHAD